MPDESTFIVRCFACDSKVRASATTLEPTGEEGDLERWCYECLRAVDVWTHELRSSPTALESGMNNILMDDGNEVEK